MAHEVTGITKPIVSVVIPTRDRAHSLGAAVNSVLNQTFRNLEVIVVDDASTDSTSQVLFQLAASDDRIRTVSFSRQRGAQWARSAGIAEARGEWLAFLDSDDTYLPESVARRLAAAAVENVQVVHSECIVTRVNGAEDLFRTPPLKGNVLKQLFAAPGPTFPGLLVRKRLMDSVGGLDHTLVAYQEWETAIRLATRSRFAFVPEPTFIWDQRGTDTISKDRVRSAHGYEQVVRKHALSMLRTIGPEGLAKHLVEAARQRAAANQRRLAWMRLLMAGGLWPPSARIVVRTAKDLWQSSG